mgnify:CR=1 FL=1
MNITALKEVLKRVRDFFKTDKSSIRALLFGYKFYSRSILPIPK